MSWCIFLDDNRNLHDVTWIEIPGKLTKNWVTVRNYEQFVEHITHSGVPEFVAFDHDLHDTHYAAMLKEIEVKNDNKFIFWSANNEGDIVDVDYGPEKTGYDCAKFLVDYCVHNGYKFPDYVVHSMNPIGKQRIDSYIANAKKHLGI